MVVYNPPGLSSIGYRTGTHSQFKQSMLSGLSDPARPELTGLKIRADDDLSVGLLDAWATIADVLTFYQERIANESYLRTATELQSIYQLARVIGFRPRPGLASCTHLAFSLESAQGAPDKVLIKEGTKVQSIPGPNQLPRIFETVKGIEAYTGHNELRPRLARTQEITSSSEEVVFEGLSLGLRPGDGLLFNMDNSAFFCRAELVELLAEKSQTKIGISKQKSIVKTSGKSGQSLGDTAPDKGSIVLGQSEAIYQGAEWISYGQAKKSEDVLAYAEMYNTPGIKFLRKMLPAEKKAALEDEMAVGYNASSYNAALYSVSAYIAVTSGDATQSCQGKEPTPVSKPSPGRVDLPSGVIVLRVRAQVFGHNAPRFDSLPNSLRDGDYVRTPDPVDPNVPLYQRIPGPYSCRANSWVDTTLNNFPSQGKDLNEINLFLDSAYPIARDSLIFLFDGYNCEPYLVKDSIETSLSDFTLTARVTALKLMGDPEALSKFKIRQTIVFGQGEELALARIDKEENVTGSTIDLNSYQELLTSGPIIVCGNLHDDEDADPKTCELVNILSNSPSRDGSEIFSVIKLQKDGLKGIYKRETVTIYANVAPATEGESKEEIVGSGNASESFQSFKLFQAPLTYVPDSSPEGFSSSLKVYVNDVKWHEVDSLAMSGPKDRVYTVLLDSDGKATIEFGDGINGSRLPTGRENVRAVYRKGLGRGGNVDADKLSLLLTLPLGVKGVKNPLAASGGSDAEELESARDSAPLYLLTLGRLVSLQDYGDFARAYPGIGKALATWIWSNQVRGILVTVCGPDGDDFDENSLQCRALLDAMHKAGDPSIPILIKNRRKALFRISASIKINSDYLPDQVSLAVRCAVVERFSSLARDLNQPVGIGEVMAAIQSVPGVEAAVISRLYRVLGAEGFNAMIYASDLKGGEDADSVQAAELLTIDTVRPFDNLGVLT